MLIHATKIKELAAEYPPYSLTVDTDKLKGTLSLGEYDDRINNEATIMCAGCLFLKNRRDFAGRLIVCSGIQQYSTRAEQDLGMLEEAEGDKITRAQEQARNLSTCGLKGLSEALTALRR